MDLTENELAALQQSATRIERLTAFLNENAPPNPEMNSQEWFGYLVRVKSILGNFNNDLSLVSCLMTKDYLTSRHTMAPFDVAEKPQAQWTRY